MADSARRVYTIILITLISCTLVAQTNVAEELESDLNDYHLSMDYEEEDGDAGCRSDFDVDYALISLTWGPGFCLDPKVNCRDDVPPRFTIHGLWLQNWPQKMVNNCCHPGKFNLNQIEHISDYLKSNWMSLIVRTSNERFWSYEWNKHGTCGRKSIQTKTVYDYFYTASRLFENLNLAKVLPKFHLTPSDDDLYMKSKFQEQLDKALGHRVALRCGTVPGQPKVMALRELRVCYDSVKYEMIDCRENSNCSEYILFPKTSRSR